MALIKRRTSRSLVSRAIAYAADDSGEALEIPEDLTTLADDELAALSTRANEAFDGLYGDGTATLSDEEYATLADLTAGIEALASEQERRDSAATDRREAAEALAARRNATLGADTDTDAGGEEDADPEDDDEDAAADEDADEDAEDADSAAQTVTADARRRAVSINLASTRRNSPRQPAPRQPAERGMRDIAYATTDTLGVPLNTGVDFQMAGQMLDRRLNSFSAASYSAAQKRGQHMREQHSLMAIRREIPADLIVASGASREDISKAMERAADISRLPGGSLTAAGWCAPSEVSYDICLTATRDGLYSMPEMGISRGGIMLPTSPSFADFYAEIGFSFTEEQAIAGEFQPGATPGAPNVVGPKPCYELPCPTWEDYRLQGDGVCITADLITQRGFPEGLAWAMEAALIAHDHRVSAGRLAAVIAGSTARTMTTGTSGTTAPLLAAIEIRAEAIRYAGRLGRNTIMEGVFPFWVRGAIRQDLSVRLGVDMLSVTNAQIDAWFAQRGIVPQYVYDWQALPIGAVTWPDTVQFLLYEAGAWVSGVDDIITLETVYDSQMLGENKYTALFTEDAWLVAPRCGESEVITVPVCSDGSTSAGVLLDCDLVAAVEGP